MREKHVLREAARDVLVPAVYDREKHPFSAPPAKVEGDDAMLALYGDVFASSLLDEQPLFEPGAVRALFAALPGLDPAARTNADGLLQRVLSATLLHHRFGMAA